MNYMGIDPGQSGGIAIVGEMTAAWKMPETERDISAIFEKSEWTESRISFAMIEKVHSMPKQGVASSFKFGMSYGFLRGMLIAYKIPFEEVSPQKWQKVMGCLTRGDKNVSKAKAQQLFPHLKVTHAIADALLIAEYCRQDHSAYPCMCCKSKECTCNRYFCENCRKCTMHCPCTVDDLITLRREVVG